MPDTTMFEEMEAVGSKLPQMVKELSIQGWVIYKHHDNWIKKEWQNDPDVDSKALDTHAAYAKMMEVPNAMKVLKAALSEDKSEGSYYYSWQANIAMAFQDQFQRSYDMDKGNIHQVANDAAKNFLDLLIS